MPLFNERGAGRDDLNMYYAGTLVQIPPEHFTFSAEHCGYGTIIGVVRGSNGSRAELRMLRRLTSDSSFAAVVDWNELAAHANPVWTLPAYKMRSDQSHAAFMSIRPLRSTKKSVCWDKVVYSIPNAKLYETITTRGARTPPARASHIIQPEQYPSMQQGLRMMQHQGWFSVGFSTNFAAAFGMQDIELFCQNQKVGKLEFTDEVCKVEFDYPDFSDLFYREVIDREDHDLRGNVYEQTASTICLRVA